MDCQSIVYLAICRLGVGGRRIKCTPRKQGRLLFEAARYIHASPGYVQTVIALELQCVIAAGLVISHGYHYSPHVWAT
jgi:hypothetical protein